MTDKYILSYLSTYSEAYLCDPARATDQNVVPDSIPVPSAAPSSGLSLNFGMPPLTLSLPSQHAPLRPIALKPSVLSQTDVTCAHLARAAAPALGLGVNQLTVYKLHPCTVAEATEHLSEGGLAAIRAQGTPSIGDLTRLAPLAAAGAAAARALSLAERNAASECADETRDELADATNVRVVVDAWRARAAAAEVELGRVQEAAAAAERRRAAAEKQLAAASVTGTKLLETIVELCESARALPGVPARTERLLSVVKALMLAAQFAEETENEQPIEVY